MDWIEISKFSSVRKPNVWLNPRLSLLIARNFAITVLWLHSRNTLLEVSASFVKIVWFNIVTDYS